MVLAVILTVISMPLLWNGLRAPLQYYVPVVLTSPINTIPILGGVHQKPDLGNVSDLQATSTINQGANVCVSHGHRKYRELDQPLLTGRR
jgi:hypothetical protein